MEYAMSNSPEEAFRKKIGEHQAPPEQIIADGEIHRYGPKKALWYVIFPDGIPAGAFGDWRKPDQQHKWCAKGSSEMTEAERIERRKRMQQIRRKLDKKRKQQYEKAKAEAERIWAFAQPAKPEQGYLKRKGIKCYNLRQTKCDGLDVLLVEARDADGNLWSLQHIYPDKREKDKLFLEGGKKNGYFHTFGECSGTRIICEGVATAASLHEATGHCTHSVFDCGNLLPAAKAIYAKYPDDQFIIAGDDDHLTKGNPGRTKALEAAQAVKGRVAFPEFGPNRSDKATDFNDLHQQEGLKAVRKGLGNTERGFNS